MLPGLLWFGGYLLSATVMIVFAWVYWEERERRGTQYLFLVSVTGGVVALLYLVMILLGDLSQKVWLWKGIQVLKSVMLLFVLAFVLSWTDRERFLRPSRIGLVAVPVLAGDLLLVTNATPVWEGLHALYWGSLGSVEGSWRLTELSFGFGPAWLAHQVLRGTVFLVSVGLLAEFTLRPEHRIYRRQNGLLVLGIAAAIAVQVLFRVGGVVYDPLPIQYLASSTLAFVAVLRFGMFDVVSLPRDSLVEAIEGGLLVYGTTGEIIDTNRVAEEVLDLSENPVGKGIVGVVESAVTLPSVRTTDGATPAGVAPDDPEVVGDLLDGHEFTTRVGGESRTFLVRVSELDDAGGHRLGWTVLFYDVTELRQKQQELDLLKQVLSRVLRHNVRNDLSVVRTNAEILVDESVGLDADRLRTIIGKADDLIDASKKARSIERIIDGERSRSDVEIDEAIDAAVDGVREAHPDASIETTVQEGIVVRGHWALSVAIENLVENAVVHNDSDTPLVKVGAIRENGTARIRVADNGPGIPRSELAVIERREETPLHHGSGVGLWLVDWIVDLSNGDITFEENEQGTVVTMSLEAVDREPGEDSGPIADLTAPADTGGDDDTGGADAADDADGADDAEDATEAHGASDVDETTETPAVDD